MEQEKVFPLLWTGVTCHFLPVEWPGVWGERVCVCVCVCVFVCVCAFVSPHFSKRGDTKAADKTLQPEPEVPHALQCERCEMQPDGVMSSTLSKHRGKNRKETITPRCSSQNTQNRGQRGETRGPQTFWQNERGPLIPSAVSISHNYMATGWDLSCWNVIRNVPPSLCDPSYTLLSSPLSALSSFSCPLLLYPIPSDSRLSLGVSQGTGGVKEGLWAHCPAPVLALPSCSLNTDPQSERVRESAGKTYQNTQGSEFHSVIMNHHRMQPFH